MGCRLWGAKGVFFDCESAAQGENVPLGMKRKKRSPQRGKQCERESGARVRETWRCFWEEKLLKGVF